MVLPLKPDNRKHEQLSYSSHHVLKLCFQNEACVSCFNNSIFHRNKAILEKIRRDFSVMKMTARNLAIFKQVKIRRKGECHGFQGGNEKLSFCTVLFTSKVKSCFAITVASHLAICSISWSLKIAAYSEIPRLSAFQCFTSSKAIIIILAGTFS